MRTRKRQIESSVKGAETFAALLDRGLAESDVYRSDPSFAAPREVWEHLQKARPDLLG
jgi:hypothetical protein